jgi:hypothetical protein
MDLILMWLAVIIGTGVVFTVAMFVAAAIEVGAREGRRASAEVVDLGKRAVETPPDETKLPRAA